MKNPVAIAFGLVLLTIFAYAPVRDAGFVNLDDRVYVTQNPAVLRGLSASGVEWALQSVHAANWHPLTWISHMLDVSLWGLEPGAHHLTNLALHAACVVLLFFLLHEMTGGTWKCAFVAAAFGLHPLHVESVAWISERKDVLCALFGVLALWVWVAWTRKGGIGRYLGALVLFGLGLSAKPMLVTFPFLLLLLDVWPLRRWARESRGARVAEKLPFFALSAAAGLLTLHAQSLGDTLAGVDALPVLFRIAHAACAYVGYLGQALWPDDLAVLYPYSRQQSILKAASCAAFLLGTSAAVLLQARARPWLAVGWFWWLGMLVPVIGLVQVGLQATADRYMHLPIVGLAIAFAWGMGEFLERRPAARALAAAGSVLLVLGWTLLTRAQAGTWKDDFSLFGHATQVTEGNFLAHHLLGGAFAEAGRPEEALQHYRLSVEANPQFADGHDYVGRTLENLGRFAEAAESFRRAVEIDPENLVARRGLAYALDLSERPDEASEEYEEALSLFPADAQLLFDYGLFFLRRKQFTAAEDQFRRAIGLRADFGEAYLYLGQALANQDRLPEAVESVREGVRLLPDRLDAREVLEGMQRELLDRGIRPR